MEVVIKHLRFGYFMALEPDLPGNAYWVSNFISAKILPNAAAAQQLIEQQWPYSKYKNMEIINITNE